MVAFRTSDRKIGQYFVNIRYKKQNILIESSFFIIRQWTENGWVLLNGRIFYHVKSKVFGQKLKCWSKNINLCPKYKFLVKNRFSLVKSRILSQRVFWSKIDILAKKFFVKIFDPQKIWNVCFSGRIFYHVIIIYIYILLDWSCLKKLMSGYLNKCTLFYSTPEV